MNPDTTSHFHQALAKSIERTVEFPPGALVTLVRAEITGDSRYAKGTISVLPEAMADAAIQTLKDTDREIKEELNKNIRLRRIPSLHWELDHTEEKAAEIERVMNEMEERGEL